MSNSGFQGASIPCNSPDTQVPSLLLFSQSSDFILNFITKALCEHVCIQLVRIGKSRQGIFL